MNGLHGIIFAYEKAPGLRELTEARMPGSVPFGGRYRVVDFMLSNMAGAGITDVGVVLHGNYQSLLEHIGSGKTWDMARKNGGLKLLPPFADARKFGVEEFRGKMEALSGVRSHLHEIRQKYVVLSASDLIINLPLQKHHRDALRAAQGERLPQPGDLPSEPRSAHFPCGRVRCAG